MKKKVMLIGIIIVLILLVTFGASVALFNGVRIGSKESSISVGDLTFKYTEVTGIGNGINLEDPEAISDEEGKQLNTWFDFKIDANLVNSDMIYEVSVEPTSETTINLDGIKIYLTEVVDDEEVDINSNYNGLGKVKVITDYDNGVIYQERILKNTKNYEKNFRVRIWISEDVDIYTDGYMGTKGVFKINVNAKSDISMVDASIPVPEITGGTGTTWTTDLQTISLIEQVPVIGGIKEYEYYVTNDSTDVPNDLTIATDTTDNLYQVIRIGKNYIYYRTVSSSGEKSAWSNPQIVYYDNTEYTITYNLNDGVQGQNPITSYNVETETFNLPTPTKTGYNFEGWYEDSSFNGEPVTQVVIGTRGNKTYYAKWVPNEYTLTLNYNDGTGAEQLLSPNLIYMGQNWNYLSVPTRTDYRFLGYYTATSGGTQIYNSNGSYISGTAYWNSDGRYIGTSNLKVYAQWTNNLFSGFRYYSNYYTDPAGNTAYVQSTNTSGETFVISNSDITLQPNATYRLSFNYYCGANVHSWQVYLLYPVASNGEAYDLGTWIDRDSTWHTKTLTFTMPSTVDNNGSIYIRWDNNGSINSSIATLYIRNVFLTKM